MKKLKIAILFMLLILLCGCEQRNNNYVKNIYISKNEENFLLYVNYYNFNSSQENYIESSYEGPDIYKLAIQAMKDNNYNFRLCENCYISYLAEDSLNDIFHMFISLDIPPSVNIIALEDTPNEEFKAKSELLDNPLYSFSTIENKINGKLPIADPKGNCVGEFIIKNGNVVKNLSIKQRQILAVLENNIDNFDYIFRDGQLFASLMDVSTYCHMENDVLNFNITFVLKNIKGISDSVKSKEYFISLLKQDLENSIYEVFYDIVIKNSCSLDWYAKQSGNLYNDINVNINIL